MANSFNRRVVRGVKEAVVVGMSDEDWYWHGVIGSGALELDATLPDACPS
jgi:hypothetical protein